jgi:hypothetical protein
VLHNFSFSKAVHHATSKISATRQRRAPSQKESTKARYLGYQNRLRARAQTIFNTKPAPHIRALYAKKVDFDVGGQIGNFSHPAATHN